MRHSTLYINAVACACAQRAAETGVGDVADREEGGGGDGECVLCGVRGGARAVSGRKSTYSFS